MNPDYVIDSIKLCEGILAPIFKGLKPMIEGFMFTVKPAIESFKRKWVTNQDNDICTRR